EATEAPTTPAAPPTTEAMGLQTLEPGIRTVGSDISWPPFEEYVDGVVVAACRYQDGERSKDDKDLAYSHSP
ncbi:MAG: hypothetical protein ABIJ75_06350, partial [Actinomycetota bacterium]